MSQSICSTGLRWLWLVVVVLIIDLGSKYLILQNFALGDTVPLFPSLNLHYARNYGAAFSFLADSGGWQRWFFAGIAIGISVILAVMMYRSKATQKLNNIAYALIIGGALGNLTMPLRQGIAGIGAATTIQGSIIQQNLSGLLGKAGGFVSGIANSGAGKAIGGVLGSLGTVAKSGAGVLGTVWGPIASGFGSIFAGAAPVIGVISSIIAVVSILGDHLEDIRGIIQNVFGDTGVAVFDKFMGVLQNVGSFITGLFADGGVANALAPLGETITHLFGEDAGAAFDGLTTILQSVMGVVGQIVSFAQTTVKPIIQDIFSFLTGTVVPIILQTFTAAAPSIAGIISGLGSAIMTAMQIIGSAIQAVMPIVQSIITVIMSIASVARCAGGYLGTGAGHRPHPGRYQDRIRRADRFHHGRIHRELVPGMGRRKADIRRRVRRAGGTAENAGERGDRADQQGHLRHQRTGPGHPGLGAHHRRQELPHQHPGDTDAGKGRLYRRREHRGRSRARGCDQLPARRAGTEHRHLGTGGPDAGRERRAGVERGGRRRAETHRPRRGRRRRTCLRKRCGGPRRSSRHGTSR